MELDSNLSRKSLYNYMYMYVDFDATCVHINLCIILGNICVYTDTRPSLWPVAVL